MCIQTSFFYVAHTYAKPLHNDSEIAEKTDEQTNEPNATTQKMSRKKRAVNVENSKFKAFFAVDKNANEQIFEIVSFGDSLFTGNK